MMALKHGGANALLALDFDGTEHLALTKQVQVDPIRRVIEHVDFVTVIRGEKVIVDVAIHVIGDAAPDTPGRHREQHVSRSRPRPRTSPSSSRSPSRRPPLGTQIHAKDLDLPKGTTLAADEDLLIVNVTGQVSAEALEAELAEAEAEAGIEHDVPSRDAETRRPPPRTPPPRATPRSDPPVPPGCAATGSPGAAQSAFRASARGWKDERMSE